MDWQKNKFTRGHLRDQSDGGVIREMTGETNSEAGSFNQSHGRDLNQLTFEQNSHHTQSQTNTEANRFDKGVQRSNKPADNQEDLEYQTFQPNESLQQLQGGANAGHYQNIPLNLGGQDASDNDFNSMVSETLTDQESHQSSSFVSHRSLEKKVKNRKSKTLTDYTLLMLNFIPVTIIQQLCQHNDSQSLAYDQSRSVSAKSILSGTAPIDNLKNQLQVPLRCEMHSVVLVAEITKFYNESKALDFNETKFYNEHLVQQSSTFLEIVSSCLQKYDGDLVQFMGSSYVAIWPNSVGDSVQRPSSAAEEGDWSKNTNKSLEYVQDVSRKAAQCALDIRREIDKVLRSKNVTVNIGICHGNFQVLHLGGVLKRIEYVISGSAYQNALSVMRGTRKRRANRESRSSEQNIAVTAETWNLIKEFFTGEPSGSQRINVTFVSDQRGSSKDLHQKNSAEQADFYFLHHTSINIKLSRSNYLQKNQIDENKIQKVQIQLKSYIPAAFRHFALIKDERLISANGSHLKQTIMAMALQLNQESIDCTSKHQLNLLQSVIEIIQMQVYLMEGSINRILTYEGGLIVLASWGSISLNHDDDAPRAIYAANNIKKKLIQFQQEFMVEDDTFVEPPVHIGIATGDIFQGMIGRFDRKEVVSIGSAFERAFLLMQTAVQHYGKLYVDQATKMSANHFIAFQFVEMLEFSHKILNETIYSVVPDNDRYLESDWKQDNKTRARLRAQEIRIHANPFFVDKDSSYSRKFSETYGRLEIIQSICDDIAEYIENQDAKNVWVLAIRGSQGSGKSLFARRLILETSYRERNLLKPILDETEQKFRFEYVVSNCSSNASKQFVGAWRPLLRTILGIYSERHRQSKEYTINSLIQFSNVDDKVEIIEQIFDLKNLARPKSQSTLHKARSGNIAMSSQSSVNVLTKNQGRSRQRQTMDLFAVEGERFEPDFEDSVIVFCLDFILQALEELSKTCCFFVIFDNVSYMGATSWKLFDLVSSQPNLLILAMCISTKKKYFEPLDDSDLVSSLQFQIMDSPESRNYYKKYLKPREREIFSIADMAPISKNSFRKALLDFSPIYERDINQHIEDLTKILDKASEKTFAEQKKIAVRMINYHQAQEHFKEISDEVMEQIMQISFGNPLTAFLYTYQAMLGQFVKIKDFRLIPTQKFRNSVNMNDWTSLVLPWPLFKHNQVVLQGAIHDSKFESMSSKKLQMLSLLQTAAIIGDNFNMTTLDHINNKFHGVQSNQTSNTIKLLRELEQRDLIELIYDDSMTNDVFYRFTLPFIRVMIYQSLPWEWRVKEIHQLLTDYMKEKIVYDYTTGWSVQKEYMIMLRHMMASEKVFQQSKLSLKARKILVVKKINQCLSLNKQRSQILTDFWDCSFEQNERISLTAVERIRTVKLSNIMVMLTQSGIEFHMSNQSDNQIYKSSSGIINTTLGDDVKMCVGYAKFSQLTSVQISKAQGNFFVDAIQLAAGKIFQSDQQEEERTSLVIHCENWQRKDDARRSFVTDGKTIFQLTLPANQDENFKARNDYIEWAMAIEYLKAKQTFDSFADNFGHVNFSMPRLNKSQLTTDVQKREANNHPKDIQFGKEFSTQQQRELNSNTSLLSQHRLVTPDATEVTDEGASERHGSSSAKFKQRRSTIIAGLHLNSVSQKQVATEDQTNRAKVLSKKLLAMYNVAAISFYGHMQTCALKDPQLEEDNGLRLGKLSAIDHTNNTQMSTRKSTILRRQTMRGDTIMSFSTYMQFLVRKNLPKGQPSSAFKQLSSRQVQPFRFLDDDSSTNTLLTTEPDHHLDVDKQPVPERVPSYTVFEQNEHNMSQAYQTLNGSTAEENLFREERYAENIGRTRPGHFISGQKIGVTSMCLQEKLDGELGNFKILKRNDRIGYNQVMSPFIAMVSEKDSNYESKKSLIEQPSVRYFASNKSSKQSLLHTPNNQHSPAKKQGVSISSVLNGAQLPKNTRTVKGIAIEKVLEGTQKPWFMITGMDYNKPSPFWNNEEENQNDSNQKTKKHGSQDSQIGLSGQFDQELKNLESQNDESKGAHDSHFFNHHENHHESKGSIEEVKYQKHASKDSSVSHRSAASLTDKMRKIEGKSNDGSVKQNDGRDSQQSQHSYYHQASNHVKTNSNQRSTIIMQQDHVSNQSSEKSLISLIKDQNQKIQSNAQEATVTLGKKDSKHLNSAKQINTPQIEKQNSRTSSRKEAALILCDNTPFAVIQGSPKNLQQHLTADQVNFELNANDIIFLQKDLPQQDGSILTQGYCMVQNKQVCIILPKQFYRPLTDEELFQMQQSQTNAYQSPSQMLSNRLYPKMEVQDSADQLLMRSPTELGLNYAPTQMAVQHSKYSNMSQLQMNRQQQSEHTFSMQQARTYYDQQQQHSLNGYSQSQTVSQSSLNQNLINHTPQQMSTTQSAANLKINMRRQKQNHDLPKSAKNYHRRQPSNSFQQNQQKTEQVSLTKMEKRRQHKILMNMQPDEEDGPHETSPQQSDQSRQLSQQNSFKDGEYAKQHITAHFQESNRLRHE